MIASVLNAYGLQQGQMEVEVLRNGLINTTWKITTDSQSFILQRVNDAVFVRPYDIAFNIRTIDRYLKEYHPDYRFVSPIMTLEGEELVHDTAAGYFRLFPFMEGSHTIEVVTAPEQAYEAAFQFGKFTRLLSGFDASQLQLTIPDFHNLSLRYQQFELALQYGHSDRIHQSEDLIREVKSYCHIVETYEKIKLTLPQRVIHHDTKISNILFDRHGKSMAIIDLDTVMPGYFISDVGDMMRTYLSPASEEEKDFSKICIREDYFSALVRGYLTSMGDELTQEEKSMLLYSGYFLIYMQALRFLTDYCNHDSYYGAAYESQNLVRASNQICLLKRLEEKAPVLQKIIQEEFKQ